MRACVCAWQILTEADRLGRGLEALQAGAAAKLHALLASFLERVLPSGEVRDPEHACARKDSKLMSNA